MKKILPLLAVLGGAAALVAYKMKKDEQKHLVDLDEGLLYDDDDNDVVEESLISDPKATFVEEENVEEEKDTEEEIVLDDKPVVEMMEKDENVEYDETYTHLPVSEVTLLKDDTDARLAALAEKNDDALKERAVSHHLKFPSEASLNEFKNIVINHGYVIKKGEEEFELIALHITSMEEASVLKHVYYLADCAAIYKGIYKGWETTVITL